MIKSNKVNPVTATSANPHMEIFNLNNIKIKRI